MTTAEAARDALIRQVTGAVQWEKSHARADRAGVENFVEVGPGKVLSGLMRQIDKTKTALNVENEATFAKVKEQLGQVR